jgi:hypothetical protein
VSSGRPRGLDAVHQVIGRAWDRLGEPPIYGSDEWAALEPTDPRWLAAIVRAAEAHRIESTPQAITDQLVHEHRVVARRMRLASYDVAAAADWAVIARSVGRLDRVTAARAAADRGEAA